MLLVAPCLLESSKHLLIGIEHGWVSRFFEMDKRYDSFGTRLDRLSHAVDSDPVRAA